jgi:2-polyprenyl-3-methyl-5-hydroxy-6-metoxy-1,4-benzoquinol methylase
MNKLPYTCKLCGSNESSLLQIGVRHAPEAEVRRCTTCDLVFLSPQPSEEELEFYYSTLYREDYRLTQVEQRHRNDLEKAYLRVQRLLPRLKPETRLLEVGSGSGAFLYAVRPYVKEVIGVEPDTATRRWIEQTLGFKVLERIPADGSETGGFDVVVSFHVLEHVPAPVDFLAGLQKVLKPQGEFVVEVPNVDDVLVGVYQVPAYLQFYFQKAHLYYFSQKTLALALEKAGYQATICGIQRYDLSNHIRWMLSGQPGGQGYYGGILAPAVQAAYADALIHAGHSDTLWGVARKTPNFLG